MSSAIEVSSKNVPAFIGAVEDHWELYSDNPSDYTLGAPIGFGASSIVYQALYQSPTRGTPPIPVALKVLDLDSLPPHSLALLQRETTLMSLSKHPNVLRVRGSWMDGHKLYIAMRLMNKGSAADVMRYGWPGGLEESVIKCILSQALQGLNYLHINGFIHRDVKAANLLIDEDGTVLLGDLGVAADLSEDTTQSTPSSKTRTPAAHVDFTLHQRSTSQTSGSSKRITVVDPVPIRPRMGKRKSFVGTPCWMAPELIQGKQYDSSADIWSFGITALELSQGRPPRSRESPQKVLLKTIQEAPPTLDREGGIHKYSRAFQEMVESCLVKDPSKRPTAEQLLQSPFFKGTKKKSYLIGAILKDLPPLSSRQERRVLPKNAQTTRSVDSWDFPTLLHSPTNTNRRNHLEETEEVFEMDSGADDSQRRHSLTGSLSSFGRSISWADRDLLLDSEDTTEPSTGISSDSSPSDSDSFSPSSSPALFESETPEDESPQPSPPHVNLNIDPKEAVTTPRPDAVKFPSRPLAVERKTVPSSDLEVPPETQMSTSPSSFSVLNKKSRIQSSSPGQGGGLWNKIKTAAGSNMKRATSFSGKHAISRNGSFAK
ncbi:hypothetical protein VKT23_003163 [Stygiomarasmius scandens]|uniref:Protein kinase domain-containing protein n=1 Tax=Marasmiellus scandens TaxID=2682957 RepID=A0ABR1JWD3_9AGAR